MMTPSRKLKCGSVCSEIAEKVSSDEGFVRVFDLAKTLNVQIVGRPLLVEGLIARPSETHGNQNGAKTWKVFFNSERFGVTSEDVANETRSNPLSERLRFTLAHEVAHTLSFRADTFGLAETVVKNRRGGGREATRDLEEEANYMAPILLVSDASLKAAFKETDGQTLRALAYLRKKMALSREVVVSKLQSLRNCDREALLNTMALRDRVVAIGKWKSRNSAQIIGWPCLVNFGNNLVPDFVLKALAGEFINFIEIFGPDFDFKEDGELVFESTFRCGTPSNPSTDFLKFRIEAEAVSRRSGSSFIFVVTPQE